MDDQTFDVYLTGAADKSPSVQMRLASVLAARFRLPAALVAEALEGVPCRVAQGLGAPQAQSLVEVLVAQGAMAALSPAGSPFKQKVQTQVQVQGQVAAGTSPRTRGSRPATARSSAAAPPPSIDEELALARGKDGRITLRSADVDAPRDVPMLVEVSEPIDFAEPGPDGRTGVRGSDTARCPIHGLVYNRRIASGCVQCLAPARAQARKVREESRAHLLSGAQDGASSLGANPVRRAFWGLAVSLLLGFAPAAYYTVHSHRQEVAALRAQQSELSVAPATKESLERFDRLEAAVDDARRRGALRTLLIWVAAAGVTGAVWTRLTRAPDPDGQPG